MLVSDRFLFGIAQLPVFKSESLQSEIPPLAPHVYESILKPPLMKRPTVLLTFCIVEASLQVKLPTIWTDEKHSQEEAEPGRNSDAEKVRMEKMQVRKKVGKSRNTVYHKCFVAPEGRKSRLAKAAGAEPAGQIKDEKLHAVVARSTFGNEHVQNTSAPEHF